ncbi:MAG: DinB family protein [Chloroflexota bacterium]
MPELSQERADLLETLAGHRHFLRVTTRDITEAQARLRTTVSELCLGGLIKHVTATERQWARFIVEGPAVMATPSNVDVAAWARGFTVDDAETLAGLLAEYEKVAAKTDQLVRTLPDLDASQPLPEAPWFPQGARWSARRVLLHIITETSQHAGHADIIRETLDGAKTMG